MNIEAFGDELLKIAFYQKLVKGFTNAMKDGWHGTPTQIANGQGQTWFGKGRVLNKDNAGPIARRVEEATSLGGLTRVLPVGGKSLMALGLYGSAKDAVRPVDPTGQDRSRAERVMGLAGDTAGNLAGGAIAMRMAPKSPFMAPIVGGLVGGKVMKDVATAPFRAFRNRQQPQQPQPQQPMPQQQGVV